MRKTEYVIEPQDDPGGPGAFITGDKAKAKAEGQRLADARGEVVIVWCYYEGGHEPYAACHPKEAK